MVPPVKPGGPAKPLWTDRESNPDFLRAKQVCSRCHYQPIVSAVAGKRRGRLVVDRSRPVPPRSWTAGGPLALYSDSLQPQHCMLLSNIGTPARTRTPTCPASVALRSIQLSYRGMEPSRGIEPPSYCLQGSCSASVSYNGTVRLGDMRPGGVSPRRTGRALRPDGRNEIGAMLSCSHGAVAGTRTRFPSLEDWCSGLVSYDRLTTFIMTRTVNGRHHYPGDRRRVGVVRSHRAIVTPPATRLVLTRPCGGSSTNACGCSPIGRGTGLKIRGDVSHCRFDSCHPH